VETSAIETSAVVATALSRSASIEAKSAGGAGTGTGGAETVPVEVTEGVTAWPAVTVTGSGVGATTPGEDGCGG
jgi:hypothetical protein